MLPEFDGHFSFTRSENAFPYFLYYMQKCEEQMETSQGQLPCRTQQNECK